MKVKYNLKYEPEVFNLHIYSFLFIETSLPRVDIV